MDVRKPEWLKVKVRDNTNFSEIEGMIEKMSLNTVCREAACPNRIECYSRKTATFMILGRKCSRNCLFCNVEKDTPEMVDDNEPANVAKAISKLKLKHVVITSVTRDDLDDGGSTHFANVIKKVREENDNVKIEVLIPDFMGKKYALQNVADVKPDIIGHNIETAARIFPIVRSLADYERSMNLLKQSKLFDNSIFTKSAIMLGLGETQDEVLKVFEDLRNVDCDFLSIGQYLAPSKEHYPVKEYVHPDTFDYYKEVGQKMGFKYVASGPFVRSSYQADKALEDAERNQ
jgi:lipoic acid synthetase